MRFLLFLLLTGPCFLFAKSPTLHGLVVADTVAQDIRAATASDVVRVKKFLTNVAKEVNLRAHITTIEGRALTPEKVLGWLTTTAVAPEDIFFCYFTGHGTREALQT